MLIVNVDAFHPDPNGVECSLCNFVDLNGDEMAGNESNLVYLKKKRTGEVTNPIIALWTVFLPPGIKVLLRQFEMHIAVAQGEEIEAFNGK